VSGGRTRAALGDKRELKHKGYRFMTTQKLKKNLTEAFILIHIFSANKQ
jgi:hypothetical protein